MAKPPASDLKNRKPADAKQDSNKDQGSSSQAARQVATAPSSMFLSHNQALAPPYRVLMDTNFINLSLENRIDITKGMMDCLLAKCTFLCGCLLVVVLQLLRGLILHFLCTTL